jgi:peptide methionine sulfoxide reductase msrA/msrB
MSGKLMALTGAMVVLAAMALMAGCHGKSGEQQPGPKTIKHSAEEEKPAVLINDPRLAKAVFAGGSFWCMVPPFEDVRGVKQVVAGYAGCPSENPTWEQVAAGRTGCLEAVAVVFDPRKISYPQLLKIFWRQIDPTDPNGQFSDRGDQYRTAVYYANNDQKFEAIRSKSEIADSAKFDKPLVTMILPSLKFHPAEQYQQDYYKKHPQEYEKYRQASGRDQFLQKIWGSPDSNSESGEQYGSTAPAPGRQ